MLAERFWHRRMGAIAGVWVLALLLPQAVLQGPAAAASAGWHAILIEYLPFVMPAARALHGRGRDTRARRQARRPGGQHGAARHRRRDCRRHGHHWRLDGPDPSAAARQRASDAQGAPGRVLHHHRGQCRRREFAARRSAALYRFPARGAVFLAADTSLAATADRAALLLAAFYVVDRRFAALGPATRESRAFPVCAAGRTSG